ncbi:ion transporter [Brevibacillus borstelensis]|uniref:potassium channel family protein n=1 Tax=Brevibacillus borstelensis TaxID=45462 RepID=UPI002E210AD6|nr:ion transporter [Brevibacillus borstelensis]
MFFRVMYEIFVILLVITYAIIVFADPASHPRLTEEFMNQVDVILISFLAAEYVIRLWLAQDKKKFVISNWFDLVAMIPLDHYFYLARFMRILRLVRILRASPFLWSMLKSKPMQRVIGVVTLIMLWSSGAIYLLEAGINENIVHFGDALWWSIVTTTTVGYGDISPVTTGGRIMATILMVTGIGTLGALTANFAHHWTEFQEGKGQTPEEHVHTEKKMRALQQLQQVEQLTSAEYEALTKTIEELYREKNQKER